MLVQSCVVGIVVGKSIFVFGGELSRCKQFQRICCRYVFLEPGKLLEFMFFVDIDLHEN